MAGSQLIARGDRDLASALLDEPEIRQAIARIERQGGGQGARRQLLAIATRLTAEMAPDLHDIVERARATLGVASPLEIYVYPEPHFNAAAVRPERGRLLLLFSSALLEAFAPDELAFVAGHEVGHWLFEHHRIPVAQLLAGDAPLAPTLLLRLFAWQRYAEISADRAGAVAAGSLEPAARALFKLASGLGGRRVEIRIEPFLSQVGDLREELEKESAEAPSVARQDWFATHPFSPLRLKAVEAFNRAGTPGLPAGEPDAPARDRLEAEVDDLMTLMDPSYLVDRSEVAEAMRRLLFAAGVAVAAVSGEIGEETIAALERLLGPGSIPPRLKPDVIRADLPGRIALVNRIVPPLRRAQVIRDLCVIARAEHGVHPGEIAVIREIAAAIGVDESLIPCALDPQASACATGPPEHGGGPEAATGRPSR